MALTDKERLFVDEYLKCWNKTKAAKLAGYSEAYSRQIGHEVYNRPEIREMIEERVKQSAMSADEALSHVGQIARGEWAAAFNVNESGTIFRFDPKLAEELGLLHLIQEAAPVPNTAGYKFKFPSRLDALKTILTALGVLKGDVTDGDIARFLAGLAVERGAKDRSDGGEAGEAQDRRDVAEG